VFENEGWKKQTYRKIAETDAAERCRSGRRKGKRGKQDGWGGIEGKKGHAKQKENNEPR